MGRLPKGFKKTLQHKQDEAPEGAATVPAAAAPAAKDNATHDRAAAFLKSTPGSSTSAQSTQHGSSSATGKPSSTAQQNDSAHGGSDDDDDEGEPGAAGPETRGHMIQRHKKEMLAFKKNLQRMGKKSKDEIAKMTAEIEQRHAKELADVEAATTSTASAAGSSSAATADGVSTIQGALGQLSTHDHHDEDGEEEEGGAAGKGAGKTMTKAMKRRAKQAEKEAEREARVAAEAAAAGPSARAQEEEALAALLQPLGLVMREIRADGHCLYRALEDQLALTSSSSLATTAASADQQQAGAGGGSSVVGGSGAGGILGYQELRQAAAAHMRAHPDQFMHYLDVEDGEDPAAAFEAHCAEVEGTAAWGGQLEASVLAQVLKRPICVYAVGMPPVTLGTEYPGPPLQVCYLRHAFGLGEHYNSLGPAGSSAEAGQFVAPTIDTAA